MFWRQRTATEPGSADRLVWLERKDMQWIDPIFFNIWNRSMEEAFDLLGMTDRYRTWNEEKKGMNIEASDGPEGLERVVGWKNRRILSKATGNIHNVSGLFEFVPVPGGSTLRYCGDRRKALDVWQVIVDLKPRW